MIAPLRTLTRPELKQPAPQRDQERFLQLLPRIQRQARWAFRTLHPDLREDLIAETIALAYVLFLRLVRRGRIDLAYATPLASFAIRQVRTGRRLASRSDARDGLSSQSRTSAGIVERLDVRDEQGAWFEVVVEDRRSTPAETAAARIDIADWLTRLSPRNRGIAIDLGMGETAKDVAGRFRVSAGRVSQLRGWLASSWERFQADCGRTTTQ